MPLYRKGSEVHIYSYCIGPNHTLENEAKSLLLCISSPKTSFHEHTVLSLPFLQLLKSLDQGYTLTQHLPFVYALISEMPVKIFDKGHGIFPTEDSLHSPYRWSDKLLSDYTTNKRWSIISPYALPFGVLVLNHL